MNWRLWLQRALGQPRPRATPWRRPDPALGALRDRQEQLRAELEQTRRRYARELGETQALTDYERWQREQQRG